MSTEVERRLRTLTGIIIGLAVVMLLLGGVSVHQEVQNGDLAEKNEKAIDDVRSSRVQITWETCDRQNRRVQDSVDELRAQRETPQAKELAKRVAAALGLTEEQYEAFSAAQLRETTNLIAKITLDEPVVKTPDGPRRDCEKTLVDRFGEDARLVEGESARERVDHLLNLGA